MGVLKMYRRINMRIKNVMVEVSFKSNHYFVASYFKEKDGSKS